MTILHLDGFDGASDQTGNSSEVDTSAYLKARYDTPTFNSDGPVVYGGWGGTGLAMAFGEANGADNNYIRFPIPETQTTVVGLAMRPQNGANINSVNQIMRFRHLGDGVQHVTIHLIGGQHLRITTGTSLLRGSLPKALQLGRWNYIEIKIKISNTIGTIDVQVNGVNKLSLTSVDTFNGGGGGEDIDTIELVGVEGTSADADGVFLFDDFYILDTNGSSPVNDFLGPIKIEELLPDGAGDDTDWTPSTGSNFQNVDETPRDDDTTYNESLTSTDLDLFTADNLVKIDGTIYAVQLDVAARVTDAGAFTLDPTVKVSSTEGVAGSVSVTETSYDNFSGIFEQDPDAAAAWTDTTVNAMQFGYEVG